MTKRGWTSTGIVLTALCLHGQSPTPAQEPILPLVNARPDDRVTLFDGARLLTTVAAPTGTASLSGLPKLTPGTHDIRAHIRGGDAPQAAARVTIPNAGGRAFQRQTSILAGRDPKALAKADFDGDGWIDVVVLDSASALHLLRGHRGGSFQKTQRICEEDAVEAIASGDLNGDGLADLVLTGPKGTRVLAGDGRGGVLSKPLAQLQESGVAILIADWTGDGIADLMLLHPDKDRASFLAGIAQGGFTPRGELRFADRVSAMTAADFDLDGITDLAVARGESHLVTIFRGRGDLQFERGGDFAAGGIPIALDTTAGDEQGPHLVVRLAGSTEAVLLAAKGGATFYPPSAVPGLWADSADALEADLNGDGAPDRVTASQNAALDVGIRAAGNYTISKTHSGSFYRGMKGARYTILVTGDPEAPMVTDILPPGLILKDAQGPGWECIINPGNDLTCFGYARDQNGNLPPLTVVVDVAPNAPNVITNTATVTGGATASDTVTLITGGPGGIDLAIAKSHPGNFPPGAIGRQYTLLVTNVGVTATNGGLVGVLDTLPSALTATAIAGPGWACTLAPLGCTRSGALAPGASFPPIVITVNVAANAPYGDVNLAEVGGGGDANPFNNVAEDFTAFAADAPDLSIVKSHAGIFTQGQSGALYSIAVTNVGSAASTGLVTVYETLPAGLTATGISGAGWNCNLASLVCTRSDALAIGASFPAITVTVNVDSNAPSSVINIAGVSSGGDQNPANDQWDDTTLIQPPSSADLTITKSHVGNFRQGQLRAHYTIGVTNVGGAEPTGTVTITENPPAGMTIVEMGALVGWNCNGNSCTASPTNYSVPLNVYVNVSPTAAANLTNTATVSTAGDSNTTNNTASDPTIIDPASPDLTITKSHTGDFARGQQGVTYTLTVTNVGDAPSYGTITVTENPPAGLTITGMSGQNWSCDATTRTCTNLQQFIIAPGGGVGVNQPIIVTADVALNAAADIINQATVSGGGDSTPGNNTASDPTHTTGPDLRISKTHHGNFYQGQLRATYTIGVTNIGQSEPTGTVTVTDTPPPGMTIVSMSSMVWNCSGNSCTAPASTYTAPITVSVDVSPTAAANLTNTATVSTAGDSNTTNNTASDPTTIDPASPDLTITKSHTGNFARGQQDVTYTLTVTNIGNAPSNGTITVTENPPAGLTITGMSGQNWSCDVTTRTCTNLQQFIIPPGGGVATNQPITVTADVAINAPADFINQATVSGGGDSTPGNNTASDPTHTTGPDLRLTKTHRNDFYQGQPAPGTNCASPTSARVNPPATSPSPRIRPPA
ncbi:MAG: DUF11 domain-containing protein [Bryobacterales bacterium]|nr:DUF11 domain-containing protein [Bryobacterales bacterium]